MSRNLETRLSRLEGEREGSRFDCIKGMTNEELHAIVDEARMAIQEEHRRTGRVQIPRLRIPNGKEVVSRFVVESGIPLSDVIWGVR